MACSLAGEGGTRGRAFGVKVAGAAATAMSMAFGTGDNEETGTETGAGIGTCLSMMISLFAMKSFALGGKSGGGDGAGGSGEGRRRRGGQDSCDVRLTMEEGEEGSTLVPDQSYLLVSKSSKRLPHPILGGSRTTGDTNEWGGSGVPITSGSVYLGSTFAFDRISIGVDFVTTVASLSESKSCQLMALTEGCAVFVKFAGRGSGPSKRYVGQ